MDAVHKRSEGATGDGGGGGEEGGGGGGGRRPSVPKIEDITDTMIFSPNDLVTMTCRDVDLSFAVRGNTHTHTIIDFLDVNVNSIRDWCVLFRWQHKRLH